MFYIIAYDISDKKRLQRVATTLLDYGFRIQASVFFVDLEMHVLESLQSKMEKIVNRDEDKVKFFKICARCAKHTISIGLDDIIKRVDNKENYIVT